MRPKMLVAMTCALWLVACGAQPPEAPTQPFQADGVRFSLTPSAARDCEPDTRYEAVVRWDVQRPGRSRFEVRLEAIDGPLFARSNDASGHATTGDWVSRGMWFLLLDRDSGDVLAAQRAGPERCD